MGKNKTKTNNKKNYINRFENDKYFKVDIDEWTTTITENLRDGMVITTINNKYKYTFDKKLFKYMEKNLMDFI